MSRTNNDQQTPFSEYEDGQQNQTLREQIRGHVLAAGSELIGTTMFLWFAFAATHAAVYNGTDATSTDGLLFISLSFGFSLMVHAWAHYRISGGLFNPAVGISIVIAFLLLTIRLHSRSQSPRMCRGSEVLSWCLHNSLVGSLHQHLSM